MPSVPLGGLSLILLSQWHDVQNKGSAYSGTGTEMIQACLPECVAVPEPCDERPDRLFKPISPNPRGGIKVCSDFS